MKNETVELKFFVEAEDAAIAGQAALALSDAIHEIEGVSSSERQKIDPSSMDLGTVVVALASSGAAVAIAQGLAVWLSARRNSSVTVEISKPIEGFSESFKIAVSNIDPKIAKKITEIVVKERR